MAMTDAQRREAAAALVEAERTHDLHLWQLVAHYNLVVVDELGCRRQVSDWEYSVVKRVADLREQKATVWISNHPPERIRALFDDRIASRLLCGTWFALEGHDRRQEDG